MKAYDSNNVMNKKWSNYFQKSMNINSYYNAFLSYTRVAFTNSLYPRNKQKKELKERTWSGWTLLHRNLEGIK